MGWTREAVLAEVRETIEAHADAGACLDERTELVADLGIDSLGVMEVVAELEDRFGMRIGDAELRNVVSLGDVACAIVRRLDVDGRLDPTTSAEAS